MKRLPAHLGKKLRDLCLVGQVDGLRGVLRRLYVFSEPFRERMSLGVFREPRDDRLVRVREREEDEPPLHLRVPDRRGCNLCGRLRKLSLAFW